MPEVPDIYVLPPWSKSLAGPVVSTIARDSELSPFSLGPCDLYDGIKSRNLQNAWEYTKVYPEHLDSRGDPTLDYWLWAQTGWKSRKPVKNPMGDRLPSFHLWEGKQIGLVQARAYIFVPLYAQAVKQTEAYQHLKELWETCQKRSVNLTILDYDAHNHHAYGLDLSKVLMNPGRQMGHGFVLAMLLKDDPALKLCRLSE